MDNNMTNKLSPEQKAEEYIRKKSYSSRDFEYSYRYGMSVDLKDIENALRECYLEAHAAALRWVPHSTPPDKTGEYIVKIDDHDNCGPYITSHLYTPEYGWSIQVGQSILCWLPLPAAPKEDK